jgi:hypothetical protein
MAIVQLIPSGEENHRSIAPLLPQSFENRQAIFSRHHDVEHDDIVFVCEGAGVAIVAIVAIVHDKPLLL